MTDNQITFEPIIERELDTYNFSQRVSDGYFNATLMAKNAGKQLGDYLRLGNTIAFVEELSSVTGIPVSGLVQIIKGGTPNLQGTWIHPDVAINLGQWLSPKFAVAVSQWVREWFTGSSKTTLPYHIKRYLANNSKIPHTHFSMLNELIIHLISPLEQQGYTLPDNMIPDISEGKIFSRWLREEKQIDPTLFPTYIHIYNDGREVMARLYPNILLADFRKHFFEEWLPDRSEKYFKKRDDIALKYLPSLIQNVLKNKIPDSKLLEEDFDTLTIAVKG